MRLRAGFTMLEILLSVSMIAILTGLLLPLQRSFVTKNALTLSVESAEQAIYQAQSYARAQVNDAEWGVYMVSGDSVVVFQGSSYAARVIDEDIVFDLYEGVTVSGDTEIIFQKHTAHPAAAATTAFMNTDGRTQQLSISQTGVLTIE